MADGVRLKHKFLTNTLYTFSVRWRPYSRPFLCPTCNITHEFKTYHLQLDDQGCVIISTGILKRLLEVGLERLELSVMNVISKPPPIVLDLPSAGVQTLRFNVTEKKIGRREDDGDETRPGGRVAQGSEQAR